MNKQTNNQYCPDSVTRPGATLNDLLIARGMSQIDLAERIGRSLKHINQIIKGKATITQDTSLLLEMALGVPARFWNNRESNYREYLAKKRERAIREKQTNWLRRFPIKELIKYNWIARAEEPAEQLQQLLRFFGVSSPDGWKSVWMRQRAAAFRKSTAFSSDPHSVSAWLRCGEIKARNISTKPFSEKAFREVLRQARYLTKEPPETFQPRLTALCAEAGVALVFIPELPRIRACGATKWLQPDKALIQLCLRYKSNDQLWFSFFHEAGHILLHGKRDVFIEDKGHSDAKEKEADDLASDMLIPRKEWDDFLKTRDFSKGTIAITALNLGIAPGILVGRLQHDKHILYTQLNDMKEKLVWKAS